MSFPVYDDRADIHNLLVTPQIRACFLRTEPRPLRLPGDHAQGSYD